MKSRLCKLLLIGCPLLFFLATLGMWQQIEPFSIWFYCFAWWSYILFAEAWLYRRGAGSLLLEQPGAFVQLCVLSIPVWLIFECYNFRLHNWHYLNLPANTPVRWFGYAFAFATVLPGIFVSDRLLARLGWFPSTQRRPWQGLKRLRPAVPWLGLCLLLLPIAWPRYAFPCVWLGFIFFLDPLNDRLGANSLLRDLERGDLHRWYRLSAAGMWCGLLWELWNYRAGSKWVYTLPYFNSPKLFEMPLAGFFGFAPFALECFVMANAFAGLRTHAEARLSASRYGLLTLALWLLTLVFVLSVFSGIDRFSVASYVSQVMAEPARPTGLA